MQVRPVRFLHVGPLRLGEPPRTSQRLDPRARDELIRAAGQTWTRVVETALEAQVDFVLLNGQTFDADRVSAWAEFQFEQGLDRLLEADIACAAIPAPGDSLAAWNSFADLVEVFDPHRTGPLEIADARGDACARIVSLSAERTVYDSPAELVRLGVRTDSTALPDEMPRILDYLLAGSSARWKPRGGETPREQRISAPQPLSRDESGVAGCLLSEFHSSGAWNVERRPLASVRFIDRQLFVADDATPEDLCLEMQSELDRVETTAADRLWLVRWEIRGAARWIARIEADAGSELESAWRSAFANREDDLHILHEFAASGPSVSPRTDAAGRFLSELAGRINDPLLLPRASWRGALEPLFQHDPDAERLLSVVLDRISEEQLRDHARSVLTQAAASIASGEDVR